VSATVIPRSLKEAVGFSPSCLKPSSSMPAHRLRDARRYRRVAPSGWVTISEGAASSTPSRKRQTPLWSASVRGEARRASNCEVDRFRAQPSGRWLASRPWQVHR
jgi:hypothetical protein